MILLKNLFKEIKILFQKKELRSIHDTNFLSRKQKLENILGFKIKKKKYYLKALTHRSYLELNHELTKSNERLEFLGDSVLNMIIAKYLFENFSDKEEGFLTKSRASLVNRDRLFSAAEEIGLLELILYNPRYLSDSNEGLKSILADALEALIGAIYLDQGIELVSSFVIKKIIEPFEDDESFLADRNFKGQLLEFAHTKKLPLPKYVLVSEEGPSHKKVFTIDVYVDHKFYGRGIGRNKKKAEQSASEKALLYIKEKQMFFPVHNLTEN